MWDPDYMEIFEELLPPLGITAVEEEEDEEEEEEEEESESESEAEAEAEEDENGRGGTTSRQVNSVTNTTLSREVVNVDSQDSEIDRGQGELECDNQEMDCNNNKGGGKASNDGDKEEELNKGEIDGLFCPICFEAWSSGGDHHICCLPCGHIYGLSCIKKWLRRRGSSKCPQCKRKCGMKDIRLLYATRIVAIDGELQKKVKSLESKCASLENKNSEWCKKEVEWKKREAYLYESMEELKKSICMNDRVFGLARKNQGHNANPNFHTQRCSNKFIMKEEFQVGGARLFGIDTSSQIFVVARRLSSMGGAHVLTKVSLLSNQEKEDIRLHDTLKAVKDLQVSPHANARLVLLASLGRKLSVLSTESNNTIITYNLPASAWSCSWDAGNAHYVYTGLQDGAVLQFDLRNTMRPVESLTGLTSSTSNIIHTLYSLAPNSSPTSGVRSVLTASSIGLCQWNFGANEERPYLIPESVKEGVCISLAYCKSSDDIVASYRPKNDGSGNLEMTQPTVSAPGQAVMGSHVLFKKTGPTYKQIGITGANVSSIRLPKSVIIDGVYENPVFASGDESTGEVVLEDLRRLMSVESLKLQKPPLREVKYTNIVGSGLLGCLNGDSLQLFTTKLK